MDSLFKSEMVRILDKFESKSECFRYMARLLDDSGILSLPENYLKAVREREDTMSTGIGRGIAIPHARSEAVDRFGISVCLLREGMEYDAIDEEPVYLIFMIAVPEDEDVHYMKILRSMSEYLRDDEKRLALLKSQNEEELYQNVQDMEKCILAAFA